MGKLLINYLEGITKNFPSKNTHFEQVTIKLVKSNELEFKKTLKKIVNNFNKIFNTNIKLHFNAYNAIGLEINGNVYENTNLYSDNYFDFKEFTHEIIHEGLRAGIQSKFEKLGMNASRYTLEELIEEYMILEYQRIYFWDQFSIINSILEKYNINPDKFYESDDKEKIVNGIIEQCGKYKEFGKILKMALMKKYNSKSNYLIRDMERYLERLYRAKSNILNIDIEEKFHRFNRNAEDIFMRFIRDNT